jgi:hypothetical protein
MLREQAPLFLENVADLLEKNAADFNEALGVTGEEAISVVKNDQLIDVGKRGATAVRRKIMYDRFSGTVRVTMQTIRGLEPPLFAESRLLFDLTSEGGILLSGQNFNEFAEDTFKSVTAAFAA